MFYVIAVVVIGILLGKRGIARSRSRLYSSAKLLGDVNAVLRGKYAQRVTQRIAGRLTRRQLNKLVSTKTRR